MTAKEILEACDAAAHSAHAGNPCMACAERAIEAAREEELARIVAVIRRNVDGPMREALVADVADRRSP